HTDAKELYIPPPISVVLAPVIVNPSSIAELSNGASTVKILAITLPLPYACNILPLTPLVSIIIRGSEMLLTPLSGSNPPYIATWFFITNGIPCVSYVPTITQTCVVPTALMAPFRSAVALAQLSPLPVPVAVGFTYTIPLLSGVGGP